MQAEKNKYAILQRQEEEAKRQRIAEDLGIRKQEEYRRQEEMMKNEAMRQQSMLEEAERQRRKDGTKRQQEQLKKNEEMKQQNMLERAERQRRKYGIERQQVENLQQRREGYERMDTGADRHTTLEELLNSISQTVKTYAEENLHLIGDLESRRTIHYCNTSLQLLKVNEDEC